MLCFDKLKIVTSIGHLIDFDKSKFQSSFRNEKLQYYKYSQKIHYELLIMINHEKDELVIEFTSKILGLGFINLINVDTIYECLSSIPFVEFDDDEFYLEDCEVLKCDITKDVSLSCGDVRQLQRYVNSSLGNYDKWKCENHP